MQKHFLLLPIIDYVKTRKSLYKKLIAPLIIAVCFIVVSSVLEKSFANKSAELATLFVSSQITIIAILIAFSIAIITILVSADNENIRRLKREKADERNYKKLNGAQLSLFQVLLSNITYNTLLEIIYLMLLIAFSVIQPIMVICAFKYAIAIGLFFITYILLILIETVVQMYLTFWKNSD